MPQEALLLGDPRDEHTSGIRHRLPSRRQSASQRSGMVGQRSRISRQAVARPQWHDPPVPRLHQLPRALKQYRSRTQANEDANAFERLTVKLRGRAPTPDERRGRTISLSARGAKQTTHHGPLQRLLGDFISDGQPCSLAILARGR